VNVLLDINVVVDVLLERQPWAVDSKRVWDACDAGALRGYVAGFTLPTIFYIARKSAGLDRARAGVRVCLEAFEISPVTRECLEFAERLPGTDFEDNLQVACAVLSGVAAVVSRDASGLANAHVPVLSPGDLLSKLSQ
jgi:predicted nucleic acid-binding protein